MEGEPTLKQQNTHGTNLDKPISTCQVCQRESQCAKCFLMPPTHTGANSDLVSRSYILSQVTYEDVSSYYQLLKIKKRKIVDSSNWLASILNFQQIIYEDPILSMNWEEGIARSTKLLPNLNGKDVLDMVDRACKTPPNYANHLFIGFPINAIFLQFMQNENGRAFFGSEKVNQALKLILHDYYLMLQSQLSLEYMNQESPNGWFCPEARREIDYSLFDCDPTAKHYGFKNWNQWFVRNFKPGVRPVGFATPPSVEEDNAILNACESIPILSPPQPQYNVKASDFFWLKDNVYSLVDMFATRKYKKQHLVDYFVGGTVYQAHLSGRAYHHWHAPVNGVIEEVYQIPGTYYMTQSQFIPYDQSSPNMSQCFLSAVATRMIIVIRANNQRIGRIGFIFIGMGEVSTCISAVKIGDAVRKGQEIGHFQYGGSSHVIVFQKKAKLRFNPNHYQTIDGKKQSISQNLNSFLAEVVTDPINQSP